MVRQAQELIPTRASLIARLKNWRDDSSWQEFFDTYWKLIYGVARRTGMTDAEAQDVVQETMASAAKRLPGFDYNPAIGSFKAWLLKLTRWRIIDQMRKRPPPAFHRLPSDDGTETGTIDAVIDPRSNVLDDLWDTEWRQNLQDTATANVKRKSDPLRYQIYALCVRGSLPPEKIAQQYRISVARVYLAKHRIGKCIAKEIARLEKISPP